MMKYGPYADLPVAVKIFSLYSHRRRKKERPKKKKRKKSHKKKNEKKGDQ